MLWAGGRCFYGWDISWQAGFVPARPGSRRLQHVVRLHLGKHGGHVATTGSFTIPMMKSAGYKANTQPPWRVASTGGQFMPPVMGSVAFVMVGLWYTLRHHCYAALVPALLFYLSIACGGVAARKDRIAS